MNKCTHTAGKWLFFSRMVAVDQKALECHAGNQEPRLVLICPLGIVVLAADPDQVP